ncbi:MAG: ABC transporter permease [Oscillospiraceae bacterium]|nr:ABC transporter permease [Oscillospiraceae bacterium]MCD7889243.1 ABC transporter permease [Oscillospiraceae bacterium]
MIAVLKHELKSYFHSLTAYFFGAFLLIITGVGAMIYNINQTIANFEYVLYYGCLVLIIIVPILTMRVVAEEKRQKTDQLLYALPITTTQVVIGKYLSLLTVFLIPLCVVSIYPLIFAQYGDVYLPTSYGSIFAFFMMGAALIAIGTFISSLTENQGIAAGISLAVILFNYYSVTISEYVSATAFGSAITLAVIAVLFAFLIRYLTKNDNVAYTIGLALVAIIMMLFIIDSSMFEGLVPNIMAQLSLFERFYVFIDGIFDVTAIIYYLTVIVFFLFLTVQSLEKRRYN